jgi:hypothetical protein
MQFRILSLKVVSLVMMVAATSTVACKKQEKCDEALATARKAMTDGFLDMELARQWRQLAGKVCGQGTALQTLDKEIVDREAALAQAVVDAAKKAADDGAAAVAKATKLWKSFDKLEEKEQDKAALVKIKKKANKLVAGLTPEYGKQVADYNTKQYKSRLKKLEEKEKK